MTKVYPNAAAAAAAIVAEKTKLYPVSESADSQVLTVWRKSLLLNCDGFTVYDSKGNLVFRVDNYSAGNRAEIVLMDAYGKSLLTIRRKRLSLYDNWMIYDGETTANPIMAVKKQTSFLNGKSMVQVSQCCRKGTGSPSSRNVMYEIEGSYAKRCCEVYDGKRKRVAEIKKKEAPVGGVAFGVDVFRLVVQPEIDSAVAMALVILLDRMYGSFRRFTL